MKTALCLGAGGFICSHMVTRLKDEGYWVRAVDLKLPEFETSRADEFLIYDLRNNRNVEAVMRLEIGMEQPLPFNYYQTPYSAKDSFDEVYQFAADMGGAGYVFSGDNDANIMHNSAAININVVEWATKYDIGKLFYSSSACIYPEDIQQVSDNPGLEESDAYPANPDSEYGWEKLFSERLYKAFEKNYGLDVRIARFHNIFGPEGTYTGGKEKAPAAICRKVIEALTIEDVRNSQYEGRDLTDKDIPEIYYNSGEIEIWGDGTQTRSFLYIDECIEAVRRLMQSDCKEVINIGSDEMISINDLAKMIIDISGKELTIKNIDGPKGVQGRNSDNTLIEKVLGWKPSQSLEVGIRKTHDWIKNELKP